ncbi:carboxylesterase [Actinoplanes sp. M2I2]|uniref:alpha/beta hydrolase n=1 Tax=Actinoplanes sp. M2I2 TaxID=1734444 RepID=UPI0020209623|nr:alpha/beta fold hydrolase [Actinoplanes sp. M2I2]
MRSLDDTRVFTTAVRAARAVIDAETADPGIRPRSRSRLLTHGSSTARSVLLLHGYTHGPEQLSDLGRDFHRRGYNVWIPRAPGHGTTDPSATRRITTDQLTAYASEALGIAYGLGSEAGVVGVSAGAILATWLAQQRGDAVRRLLLLSPFFGPAPGRVPAFAVRPLLFLYGRGLLPDRVTSRGYSLATVSRYLAIGPGRPDPARRSGLRSIAVAISSLDDVVDLTAATVVPGRIAEAAGIPLLTHVLPGSLGFGHNTMALAGRPDAGEIREQYIRLYEGEAWL